MNIKSKTIVCLLLSIDILLVCWLLIHGKSVQVFYPKGLIALRERNIIITAIVLMFTIVIPVFIFTFFVSLRYRATNTKAQYSPEWTGTSRIKMILWTIPAAIIFVLAVITWNGTHELDPYKMISSDKKPITIQVIALNWKWLFIYPEQNIASVNFVEFPSNTPVNFELTADAPMNSFWIPQLGGQMYAMAGMQTQLHLIADSPGEYLGSAVEINGSGFSGMRFIAKASSNADFSSWVKTVKRSPDILTTDSYNTLARPSDNTPAKYYASVEKDLYNAVMNKFMPAMRLTGKPVGENGMSNEMIQGMEMK